VPATSPLKASPLKSSKPHHSLGYAQLPTLQGLRMCGVCVCVCVCGALGAMIADWRSRGSERVCSGAAPCCSNTRVRPRCTSPRGYARASKPKSLLPSWPVHTVAHIRPPPPHTHTRHRTRTHATAHATALARRKRSRCNVVSIPSLCVPDALRVDDFPKGEVRTAWINMVRSPLGEWIRVPVLVARGVEVLNPLPTSPFCSPSAPPFACGVSSNRACRALLQ
jgi:hypothetical protein